MCAIDAEIVLEAGAEPDALSAQWAVREPGNGRRRSVDRGGLRRPRGRCRWRPRHPTRDASRRDPLLRTRSRGRDRDGRDRRRSLRVHRSDQPARGGSAFVRPAGARSTSRRASRASGWGASRRSSCASTIVGGPKAPSGYLRWYDEKPSWGEWLDLTDGSGEPTVAGLIAANAIDRWHRGRPDEEVAVLATDALARWAAAVRRP